MGNKSPSSKPTGNPKDDRAIQEALQKQKEIAEALKRAAEEAARKRKK